MLLINLGENNDKTKIIYINYGDVDRIRFSGAIVASVVELTMACELVFDAASIYNELG